MDVGVITTNLASRTEAKASSRLHAVSPWCSMTSAPSANWSSSFSPSFPSCSKTNGQKAWR
eukprot:10587141-Prorocentrum_lima.AAC.1